MTDKRSPTPHSSASRLCVMCKHFQIDQGTVYSEYTEDPASVGCAKLHWTLYRIEASAEFREKIRTAVTCKDYDDAE